MIDKTSTGQRCRSRRDVEFGGFGDEYDGNTTVSPSATIGLPRRAPVTRTLPVRGRTE